MLYKYLSTGHIACPVYFLYSVYMKILSLFDGVSCARLALEKNNIPIELYCASEIDKYAIKVTQANRLDTIQVGDVSQLSGKAGQFDLLVGGSPCQDLSIAKRGRKGLDGDRSGLFWEYVRILNEVKPKYFILENVNSMPKEAKDLITKTLGVEPIIINAALVSGQMRKRLFWVGKLIGGVYEQVHIPQPEDRHIYLKDILIDGIAEKDKSLCVTATYSQACPRDYFVKSSRQLIKVGEFNKGGQGDRVYSIEGKSVTLSVNGGGRGAKTGIYETTKGFYRKLHPEECEALQGMPNMWTNPTGDISNTQRYKMCGNAFNVDVVAHIISSML